MEANVPPAIEAPARVLAIGAHPDDVEHFAGATIAALAERGAAISLVICTDGARGGHESGDLPERRAALGAFHPEHSTMGLKPWFVREIWLFDTNQPDHFVDVRPMLARKRAAVACHASQNPTALHAEAERHEGCYVAQVGYPAEGFRRLRVF